MLKSHWCSLRGTGNVVWRQENPYVITKIKELATRSTVVDHTSWCFPNGLWAIGDVRPTDDDHARLQIIRQCIDEHTPLYAALAQMVVEYLHGYVALDRLEPHHRPSGQKFHRRITTLHVDWLLNGHQQTTGLFAWEGRDLFGAPVRSYGQHASPLELAAPGVDEWLVANEITGAAAFLWFATLGAWMDVGCEPDRRRRMDMVPLWVQPSRDLVRPIVDCLDCSGHTQHFAATQENPFDAYQAIKTPHSSWVYNWDVAGYHNYTQICELVDGHLRNVPRNRGCARDYIHAKSQLGPLRSRRTERAPPGSCVFGVSSVATALRDYYSTAATSQPGAQVHPLLAQSALPTRTTQHHPFARHHLHRPTFSRATQAVFWLIVFERKFFPTSHKTQLISFFSFSHPHTQQCLVVDFVECAEDSVVDVGVAGSEVAEVCEVDAATAYPVGKSPSRQ